MTDNILYESLSERERLKLPVHECETHPTLCPACLRAEAMKCSTTDLTDLIEQEDKEPERYTTEELRRRFVNRFGE
jgi:hypothetical protein